MNGCEMIRCSFWNGKNCTDTDPLYYDICRYNGYWKTKEGLARIKEYNNKEKTMANTPTPASVASRLTDEDLEQFAITSDRNAYICQTDVVQRDYYEKTAAVLRDYVRLRKLANDVRAYVDAVNAMPSAPLDGGIENQKINGEKLCAKITAFAEITRLLKEAEKGEVK